MVEVVGESPIRVSRVERWPSEAALFVLVFVAAVAIWAALAITVVGIVYALLIGLFFFVTHLAYVTHLRGSGVRLGPEQMPELYDRVERIAHMLEMKEVPAAYVVQEGGVLNAMAMKFMRSNFIVLYSDLLEACGDNTDARDFIIAHELGHVRAGHLRGRWFLLPGYLVPFLGSAYSRACEYTSDRYGISIAADRDASLTGLCILAAGKEHGPTLNRTALVAQREDLNGVWMKLGHWLQSHPPIAHRLAVLDPSLARGPLMEGTAALGAVAVLVAAVALPIAIAAGVWPLVRDFVRSAEQVAEAPVAAFGEEVEQQVQNDILALVDVVEKHRATHGSIPEDEDALYTYRAAQFPESEDPLDPYSGRRYGYSVDAGEYLIWSFGYDPDDASDDTYYSAASAYEE